MMKNFMKKPVKHRAGITLLIVLLIMLISVSVSFAFFTDRSANHVHFSTVSAVDYNYSLSGAINGGTEATITSADDEVLLIINEKNNEKKDLYSTVTLTADWQGNTDIRDIGFINAVTGESVPVTVDTDKGILTIQLKTNKIYAENSLTHKFKVILSDNVKTDTLNFQITSDVSAVKDSWAETVGPVNLKLHANLKFPTKLEVADTSAHREAYIVGDDFDPAKLILKVTYNDASIAYIKYFDSEKVYKIDKDANGTYDSILSIPEQFSLTNITALKQICPDYTSGGSGSVNWNNDEFTYTYNKNDDTYTVNWNQLTEYMYPDWFEYHYINKATVTLVPNDANDYTKGGTGTDAEGKSIKFEYVDFGNDEAYYYVTWIDDWSETISSDNFMQDYAYNGDFVLENVNGEIIYPHASYTENGTEVNCDIPITVGNAIMRSWNYDQYSIPATDFHYYTRSVTSVKFLDTYTLPSGFDTSAGLGPWDVSRDQDGSVMAYMVGTDVKICSNVGTTSKVYANEKPGTAFLYFSQLTSFDGTNFDTSTAKSLARFLESCVRLTDLEVSSWDISNVESLASFLAYSGQSAANTYSIDLSTWKPVKVKDFSDMFYYNKNMTSVGNLSGWKTESAEYMNGMFSGCYVLEGVNTTNWTTTNVIDMHNMFENCDEFTTVDVSKWNVGKVEDFEDMFRNCDKLTTLNVTGWRPSSAETFESMFDNCVALKSIDVSDWTTPNIKDTDYMFRNCEALTAVDLTGWNCANITSNVSMFERCYALKELTISKSMKTFYNGFARRCPSLEKVIFNHTASDPLVFDTDAGTYGAFKLTNDLDSQYPAYSANNLKKTTVVTNNSTTKNTVYDYLWENDFRSLLFDVTVVKTDGGSVKENTNGLTAWSSYTTGISLTPQPEDGYEFVEWAVTYTDTTGTKQTVILAQDKLSTFVMPYANITITPVWNITKVPIKLEVAVPPDETYYVPGEDYNPTGVEFTVTYDDNSTATIIYNDSTGKYMIDKTPNNGVDNYVVLTDTDFNMTHIKNLSEVYLYTPAVDYTKGGTGTDYNGEAFTFTYEESTGYYRFSFEDGSSYVVTESDFFNYFVNGSSGTVVPNDNPSETMVGAYPHAAYTENDVTVECDVIITVAAPILKNTYGYMQSTVSILDNTELLSYLENDIITEVEFVDSFDGLNRTTMDYADVSDKQNGSVIAWVDGNKLYVGGKKGVYANKQITGLFSDTDRNGSHYYYDDIKSIDVTHLKLTEANTKGYPVTTNISQVFYGCDALTTITGLENWNTASVTNMAGLFGKTSLTKITGVSGWDTSNVTSFNSMFYDSAKLEDASELAGWNTSSVTSASDMFNGCEALKTAPIANWNLSGITGEWGSRAENMFQDCSHLTELTIPATLGYFDSYFAMGTSSLDTITFKHAPGDTLEIEEGGYVNGAFRVSTSVDGSIKYWETPLETTINLPNDTDGSVKAILNAYDWAGDNRTIVSASAMLTLDLNGGEIIE